MSDETPNPTGADNYVLGPEIARGGMGYILEAEDTKLKRSVAAKLMVFDAGADEAIKRRFLREAEVLAKLAHPNIVPIHDIVWEGGEPLFYTMKRVKGRTLQSVLGDLKKEDAAALRDFTLDRLLLVFRKVCDAVAFAHSMGVIHRDLKPENIMIGEFGEVLVMDWGVAKIGNDECRMTNDESASSAFGNTLAGTVVGSPHYMSPEQARGETDSLTAQADVYSLGGILYAIATLRPPVEGATVEEVLERVRKGDIAPPQHAKKTFPHLARGRVPAAISSVAMKALRLEKSARYADVASLAADVEAFQGGFATKAEQAGTLKQLRLLMLRHKAVTALLAAIFALSIFFIVRLFASERKATQNATIATANEQRAVAQEKETQRALVTSQLSVADVAFRTLDAPSMNAALDSIPEKLRDQRWQYLSAKRDSSLGELPLTGNFVSIPHRAEQFIIANENGALSMFDCRTRATLWQVETKLAGPPILAKSEDGARVAVAVLGAPTVHIYRVADGSLEKSLVSPFKIECLTFSPDGQRLAIADINGPTAKGGIINIADGTLVWSCDGMFFDAFFSADGRLLTLCSGAYRNYTIRDAQTGALIRQAGEYVVSAARSLDGRRLALGLYSGEVIILDTDSGAEIRRARLHSGFISALAWTARGHLISLGNEGAYESSRVVGRIWETASFSARGTFFGIGVSKSDTRIRLAFDPLSGRALVSDNNSSPIQLFHLPLDLEVARLTSGAEQGYSTGFLSDTVLLGRKEYALAPYNVADPREPQLLAAELAPGDLTLAIHRQSGLVAVAKHIGRAPYSAQLYDTKNGDFALRRSLPLSDLATCADFAPDGSRLLVAAVPSFPPRSGALTIFDVATGQPDLTLKLRCEHAAFIGDGSRIVAIAQKTRTAAETRDELTIFDSRNGQPLHTFVSKTRLNALAVSPDLQTLAVAGDEQIVRIFNADTLKELGNFRAHDEGITALTFHPTLPIVATGSSDGSAKLWNYQTATLERTFLGFDGAIVALAFSPSGRLLSVESQEHAGRIFDLSPAAENSSRPPRSANSIAPRSEIIGVERFDYPDGPIADKNGGKFWNWKNQIRSSPAGRTSGTSDWDNTIAAPAVANGQLVTQDSAAQREYNGPGEGLPISTDEGLGAISAFNNGKLSFRYRTVYYRVTVTTGATLPDSFTISTHDFPHDSVLFGKLSGEANFAVRDLRNDNGPTTTKSSTAVEASTTYTLVAKLDFGNGITGTASLFLNPDLKAPEPAVPLATQPFNAIYWSSRVRIASAGAAAVTWDDLIVATAWEELSRAIEPSPTEEKSTSPVPK